MPSKPDSRSIVRSAGACWLIGRCPSTSPDMMNSAPISSMRFFAASNIIARQSMHGFMPAPKPCFGLFSISMYSSPR